MGMMAIAFGIQDEDAWGWDGPASNKEEEEEGLPPQTRVIGMRTLVQQALAWAEALEETVEETVDLVHYRTAAPTDINLSKREAWLRWAAKAHPEWNPIRPPRRLAPHWVGEPAREGTFLALRGKYHVGQGSTGGPGGLSHWEVTDIEPAKAKVRHGWVYNYNMGSSGDLLVKDWKIVK